MVIKLFNANVTRALALLVVSAMQLPAWAGNNDRLQRESDQLVRSVQNALTIQGKWPPPAGSQEMQLCSALQLFTQEVKRSPDFSSNRNNNNFSEAQMAAQRLQASAGSVDGLIGVTSSNADVMQRWMSVKNELAAATGGAYGNPYFQGGINQNYNPGFNPGFNSGFNPGFNPGFNGGFNPGFNPGFNTNLNTGLNSPFNPALNPYGNPYNNPYGNGNNFGGSQNVSGIVRDLNDSLRDFSNFAQKALRSGGFNANPANIFAMGNSLQQLQATVKNAGNSLTRGNNMAQQQMALSQMSTAFATFDTQLNQAGPNPIVLSRYAQVKNQFAAVQQAVVMNAGRMR